MRIFFNFFVRLRVTGIEHLDDVSGPVVFAPNHMSEVDALLLPLALPKISKFSPVYFVVKERRFYNTSTFGWRRHLYQSWIFRMLGAFAVRSGLQDYETALSSHVDLLRRGGAVCIFPEGRMSKTGTPGRAHGGMAYLAVRSPAAVVPVRIHGTAHLSLVRFFLRAHSVSVEFLPPRSLVVPAGTPEDYRRAAQGVLDEVYRPATTELTAFAHVPAPAV